LACPVRDPAPGLGGGLRADRDAPREAIGTENRKLANCSPPSSANGSHTLNVFEQAVTDRSGELPSLRLPTSPQPRCQFRFAGHVGGDAAGFVRPIDALHGLEAVSAQDADVAFEALDASRKESLPTRPKNRPKTDLASFPAFLPYGPSTFSQLLLRHIRLRPVPLSALAFGSIPALAYGEQLARRSADQRW
jgi:hypothetical protein